ncbi:ImmA/IrrE family metallo-endopeptidase [Pseudoclostridium thermosuccinogenes]|uniref:ImmA/IrrE family metallo-endopeptidase n=1 Tax=Clostridium thermosuccinogenes TaxID=84032 RepID=UPI002FDA9E5D
MKEGFPIASSIPKQPRRNHVKRTARKLLLSSGVSSLPIDIDNIYKTNGILCFSEEEAVLATSLPLPTSFVSDDNISAITQYEIIKGQKIYITIYKTHNRNIGHIRFTKAHELGHIFLRHFEDFDIPSTFNIQNNHDYWVLEREAEMFAAELLAPTAILRACGCLDRENIQSLCNLSEEAAEYVISDIHRDYHLMESDKASLEQQFYDFIKNKEYLLFISKYACEVCGNPIVSDDSYCRICGNNLKSPKKVSGNPNIYKSTIALKPTGRVYYCQKCGNFQIPAGLRECNICNAPLYNICKICNTKMSSESRYCPNCGDKLPFYSAGLLPDWKTPSLSDKIPDNINGFRRIKEWEFILDKLLVQEKYALHHCLKDSLAFEYSGKIAIYITNNVSAELINTSDVLKEVNTITLPYFDITYDEIDIKKV